MNIISPNPIVTDNIGTTEKDIFEIIVPPGSIYALCELKVELLEKIGNLTLTMYSKNAEGVYKECGSDTSVQLNQGASKFLSAGFNTGSVEPASALPRYLTTDFAIRASFSSGTTNKTRVTYSYADTFEPVPETADCQVLTVDAVNIPVDVYSEVARLVVPPGQVFAIDEILLLSIVRPGLFGTKVFYENGGVEFEVAWGSNSAYIWTHNTGVSLMHGHSKGDPEFRSGPPHRTNGDVSIHLQPYGVATSHFRIVFFFRRVS